MRLAPVAQVQETWLVSSPSCPHPPRHMTERGTSEDGSRCVPCANGTGAELAEERERNCRVVWVDRGCVG